MSSKACFPTTPYPHVFNTPPTLSNEDANWIINATLLSVLLLVVVFMGVSRMRAGRLNTTVAYNKDDFIAARNSQGVVSLSLSYFVSGVGAWVIFAVPQAAVIGGWIALAGYALSTMFPLLLFGLIAPTMRKHLPQGFTMNEYIHARFGLVNAIYFGLISLFYMMLYLTAEFSAAGTLASGLSNIKLQDDTWWNNKNTFTAQPIAPIVSVSVVTIAYTAIGGLPVSILTDRVQGVGIFVLTIVICCAAYAKAGVGLQSAFDDVAGPGVNPNYDPSDYGDAIAVSISLIMGVTCANMFHAGCWQRIWAAETNAAVQHATVFASVLSIIVMALVGVTGFIAYSQFCGLMSSVAGDLSFLSIPWVITTFMGEGWAVLTMIFGIAMIASTCDTLQSGMTALLVPLADFFMPKASELIKLVVMIVVMATLNVPAILLALSGQSILQLFLLADLLAATVVAPLFLGLWKRTHPYGALAGGVAGLATVFIVYAAGEGLDALVEQGGIFRRTATYAFCLAPVVSAITTAVVSIVVGNLQGGYEFEGYVQATGTKSADVELTHA